MKEGLCVIRIAAKSVQEFVEFDLVEWSVKANRRHCRCSIAPSTSDSALVRDRSRVSVEKTDGGGSTYIKNIDDL